MLQDLRSISLSVVDIQGNIIANIYDSCSVDTCQDIGENIIITTSRNGNTELSFDLLSADGIDAYESRYYNWLKPEYQIKAVTDNDTMYFLLTNNSVTHNSKNKKTTIKAPGIQCLLKYKGMDLEFSDTEGNNVGTINQLITAILKDTDWSFDDTRSARFYEKYDVTKEKYRSLSASVKTGCLSLISKACDLFEAAPYYDSEHKQVYVLPINPFSIDKTTKLPDMSYASDLYELNYSRNVRDAQRTYDSSNIATALYAYGAYGSISTGYCSINELSFYKYKYTATGSETIVSFVVKDCFDGITNKTIYCDISNAESGDVLEFWGLDRTSMLYVWNSTKNKAYKTLDECAATTITPEEEVVEKRLYNFLLDFSYYNSIDDGLSDAQLQTIAEYQINGFKNKLELYDLTNQYNEDFDELQTIIDTGSFNDYCKLNITNITIDSDNNFVLELGNPPYIWHADYDTKENKRFKWRISTGLDNQKDSINSDASVVYLLKESGVRLNWFKVYIKEITTIDDVPTKLTLFLNTSDAQLSKVKNSIGYLFAANIIEGTLGIEEDSVTSAKLAMIENCRVATVNHPIYYDYTQATAHSIPENVEWCWRIVYSDPNEEGGTLSDLYCCNKKLYNDTGWNKVARSNSAPSTTTYKYWYKPTVGQIYVAVDGAWEQVYNPRRTYTKEKIYYEYFYNQFIQVFSHRDSLDYTYNGEPKEFVYTNTTGSPIVDGNYYFVDSYRFHVLFTTDYSLSDGKTFTYNTMNKTMLSDEYGLDKTISALFVSDAGAKKHLSNMLDETNFSSGSFDSTGGIIDKEGWVKTGSIDKSSYIFESVPYTINNPNNITGSIFYYTEGGQFIEKANFTGSFTKTTPVNCGCIKITVNATVEQAKTLQMFRANYTNYIVYDGKEYKKLTFAKKEGTEIIGLVQMMKKFWTYAEKVYAVDVPAIQAKELEYAALKKSMQESLGSIYRESYWNPTNYVDGDEQKLLADAVENLDELCKPTATYNINFLDLYGVEDNKDINCLAAIHIVDDEIPINCYGYIDTINKCYDKPWNTKITINTNLTKMSQTSFQDVLSTIAEVAGETKTNSAVYSRAAALNSDGSMSASQLEGMLAAQTVKIDGGSASWETDEKGNIIISAANGQSAVKITGAGILVADTKDEFGRWEWHTAISGSGINADVISTGKLNAEYIQAGTITADKLSSNVGESLEIGANESLLLYATATDAPFQRSAGSLLTKDDGVSYIDINKDYIKINANGNLVATGSTVDIIGGNVNVKSDANVSIEGGSDVSVNAGSQVNVVGGEINMSSNGEFNVDAGSINISSASNLIAADANGNTFKLDSTGTTISGQELKLLTNSGTDGKIILGSNANYITSTGILSLHNEDLVLSGVDGSLTTKAALNVSAGGNINLTTDTSAINMEAGNINIAGGTLTANGGAVDIKATSTLDIDSPNFKIVSSTGSAEIAGKVIASSGLIGATKSGSTWSGGWNIGPNKIYSGANTSYVELNSDTSTNFAIKIGGENDPTQENAANFAVRRDGTTIINQLQRYTDDTHTALETIDLRKSLWQLNYGILNYEKKEEDDGSITLTIKRTGMPELSVNFISAGGAEIRFKNSLTENVTVENYKGTKTFKSATGYLKSILYVQDNKLYDEVTLYGRDSGQPASLISAGVLKTEIPLTGSFKENTSTGSIDYSVEYNTSEVLTGHAQLSIVVPSYDLTSRKITTKARAMSTGKTVGYDSSQYSLDSNISTQGTSSSLYASASSILTLNGSTYTTDTVNYYPAVSHSISGRTLTITSLIKQGSSSGTTRAKTSETIDVTDLLTPVSPTATTTIDVLGTERKFKTKTVYEKLTSTYYRIGTAHVPSNVTPIGSSYTSSSGYLCNSYLTIPTTTYNLISTPHTSTTITPISMSSYTSSEGYYSSSVIKVPVATHNLVVTPYTSTTITPISMASYTSTVGCLCDGTITAEPDVHYVTDEAKTSEAISVINTEYTTVNKDIIGSEGTKVSVEAINKSYDIDYDYLAAAEGEKYPQAKRTKVRYELHWGDIIGTEHEPVKKIIQPNTGYSIELKTVQGTEGDKVTITPIGNSYTTVSGYLRGDEGDKVTVPNIVMAHVVESCDYIGTEHTPVSKKIQGNTGYEVVMRNLLGTEGTTKQVTKVGTSHTTTAGQLIGNPVSKTVSVTPISGSGYTSTGGYFSIATTTAGTATNIIGTPHSSSSVTPIGTSHTYSTRKLLRSDGAMSLHTTLYEKDGEEYHSVGYGYWHMWYSDVSSYIENSSSTYAVPYLYEDASGTTTLYEAGTEINSIEYDGTLYEASAATYATVEPQYAGQSLGVSPSGGQYAKVGAAGTSSKTVYEAGTEYTHHPTDKTLYESGSVVTVVNGVSPSKIVFEEGDKEDVYSATTPLYKNGGTSYTVSGLPVGTSTLYTEGTATDVIVTDSSLYERGGSKFTIDGVHIGETVYSKWGDTEYYKTDVTLYKDNGACRYVDAEDVPTTLYAPGTDETLYDSSSKLYRTGGSRMCVVDPIPVGTSTLYGKGTEENVIESDTSLYERDGSVRYVNNAAAVSYLDETEDIDVYKADTKLYQRGTYVGYVGDTPFSSVPGTLYDKKASSDYYDASSKLYTNGGQVKAILSADVPLKVYSAKAAEQYIKHDGTLYTATSEPYALVDRLMVGKTLGTNPSAVSNFADVGATAKTVYEAGTPGQYIKYDGTLYTPSADKKAVLDDSYAGQYIGLNPTHGNYADVGATPKTVYEAGTTDEYIKYDGTLYEASADKKAVLSNTYAGQRVGLNPSAGNYIDVGGSTKTLYAAGTQAKYIKTDSTLYEKGLEENNIQETTVFVEDSTGTTVFYDKGETKNVIEITSGNNGFVSTEDTLYKPNN